jgi:FkbM family methyltransferase
MRSDLDREPRSRVDSWWLAFLGHAPAPAVKLAARGLAQSHPLALEPGWHFDAGADDPSMRVQWRRDLWEYYRQRGLTGDPVTFRWYDGLRVRAYLGNDMSLCLYVGGSFEPNEFVFLGSILRPGMTFIDGGANDGIYSLFAAKRVGSEGTVLAIEPSAREFGRLSDNVRLNSSPVSCVRAALGQAPGEATLAIAEAGHEGQNTIGAAVSNPKVTTTDHERVRLTTIDELAADHSLDRLDVIKLDVEGSEVEALLGAKASIERHRPVILLEAEAERLASQNRTMDDLRRVVDDYGYDLWIFDGETGRPRPAVAPDEPEGNAVAAPRGWMPPA